MKEQDLSSPLRSDSPCLTFQSSVIHSSTLLAFLLSLDLSLWPSGMCALIFWSSVWHSAVTGTQKIYDTGGRVWWARETRDLVLRLFSSPANSLLSSKTKGVFWGGQGNPIST